MIFREIMDAYESNQPKEEILKLYTQIEDKDYIDKYENFSLLHLASRYADYMAIQYLIENNVNIMVVDEYNATPLHYLADMKFRYYIAKPNDIYQAAILLLNAKVSTLKKDNQNETCYHLAAKNGNYAFVIALSEHNAKLTFTNRDGDTGIHIACDNVSSHISYAFDAEVNLDKLMARYDEIMASENPDEILRWAELTKNAASELEQYSMKVESYFQTVKAFIAGGVDFTEKNNYDKTALDIAVESNAKKIAAYLNGTYNDELNEDQELHLQAGGMTIHQATEKKDIEAIAALVELGADVNEICDDNLKSYHGLTPLTIACRNFDVDCVEALLVNNANPNFKDNNDKIAFAYFFTAQANININSNTFKTNKITDIINNSINHGYDINGFIDDESNTLLNLACKSNYGTTTYNHDNLKNAIINEMLSHGADVNIPNMSGITPLMNACFDTYDLLVNAQISLLENNADVRTRDINGNTALHYAANNTNKLNGKQMAELLIDFGLKDVNTINNEGKSAIDIAIEKQNEPLVKLLLQYS